MKFFYDTEFLEDGNTIDLISIGIVAEDGREYYAVNAECNWNGVLHHEWLPENVWPHLPIKRRPSQYGPSMIESIDVDHPAVKNRSLIAAQVMEFIKPDPKDYRKTQLWAWCSAYDHVALVQLWGTMASLHDTGIPFYTNDLKSVADLFLTNEQIEELRAIPVPDDAAHNALADARQLVKRYDYVQDIVGFIKENER